MRVKLKEDLKVMNIKQLAPLRPTAIMKEVIYITTPRIGFIPQLKMQGPVVTPVPVTREVAKSMVVVGIETYMIDKDTRKATLLTLENIYGGEGFNNKHDKDKDHNGEKKPAVPTTGVAPHEAVHPVTFSGVSTAPVNPITPAEEDVMEEKAEETVKEDTAEAKEVESISTSMKDAATPITVEPKSEESKESDKKEEKNNNNGSYKNKKKK